MERMTNAEAVEILKRLQDPEPWEPQLNFIAYSALDMAIAALEKQEGKGPIAVSEKSTWVKCPVCGSTDIDEYCEKCGQRIDWGGEQWY